MPAMREVLVVEAPVDAALVVVVQEPPLPAVIQERTHRRAAPAPADKVRRWRAALHRLDRSRAAALAAAAAAVYRQVKAAVRIASGIAVFRFPRAPQRASRGATT